MPTHSVPTGMPSCSAGPATPVSARPTSAPSTRRDAVGHRRGGRLADHRTFGHVEQVELHLAGVRHDGAAQHVAGARHRGEATGDQTTGDRLGQTRASARERAACRARPIPSCRRRRRRRARRRPIGPRRPTCRAALRPRPASSALAVSRTFRPSHPLARNASVGLPRRVELGDHRIEALVEPALALAPRAQRAADDHPGLAGAPTEVGQHRALDHLLHLVRHAGHRVDDLVDAVDRDRADQARRRATCLRDDRSRRPAPSPGAGCWPPCAVRATRTCSAITSATASSCTQLDAHHRGDRLAGEVVVRRAEPAAHDHRIGVRPACCAARPPLDRGCRRPSPAAASRCRWRPAARRARRCWCRRSGRAAARCRPRRRHNACDGHPSACDGRATCTGSR